MELSYLDSAGKSIAWLGTCEGGHGGEGAPVLGSAVPGLYVCLCRGYQV